MIRNRWAEASLYYDLAEMDRAKGNWNQALSNLTTAKQINQEAGDQELQMQLADACYRVYDTLGQTGQALAYFKEYVALHDTLMSAEKSKMIEELSIRIELLQRNEENLMLKQDIQARKVQQWILAGVVILGFLISLLIIVIMFQKRKNLRLLKEKAENEKLLADVPIEKMKVDQKLKEEELAKSQVELQMKEQELVYQTLLRLDLTQVNRSVQEKLLPFQHKFSTKAQQNEFLMVLRELTRDAEKDPLADFEFMFKQLHATFTLQLMARCASLSRVELQVCSLLRINLSTKDIARLLNISVGSVDMCRHRVRTKLGLDPKDNLTSFLITL